MATTNPTIDIDKGFKRIMRELNRIEKKPHVKVGLQASTATKTKKTSQKTPSQTDVLTVGLAHEFGTHRVPERSFIRLTYDTTVKDMRSFISGLQSAVFFGKINVKTALEQIGIKGVDNIKNTFKRQPSEWQKLAEVTIKRKKSTKMLLDTNQLVNSNTHKVVMK